MGNEIISGILKCNDTTYILGPDNEHYLEDELIWNGYAKHWSEEKVCARHLPQRDYDTVKPIVIIWPDRKKPDAPYVDLYYNERLTKYSVSIFGHIAININGEIFNYSHLINENEILCEEEYFYRPALGEFAPDPKTGLYNIEDQEKPYYDKFGRLFMRNIHVLRIFGMNTYLLSKIFHEEMEAILSTPAVPGKPEEYRDFNFFTRSCSTIIRDGLRKYGLKKIGGITPKDLFIHVTYLFSRTGGVSVDIYRVNQLKVPEAPYSKMTPFLNPINRFRIIRMPGY